MLWNTARLPFRYLLDLEPPTDVNIDETTVDTVTVSWTHAPGFKDGYRIYCVGQSGAENVTETADRTETIVQSVRV